MIDVHSFTWETVSEHCEKRLGECRRQIEQPGYDHAMTEHLRGRIAALREVLALGESKNPGIGPR